MAWPPETGSSQISEKFHPPTNADSKASAESSGSTKKFEFQIHVASVNRNITARMSKCNLFWNSRQEVDVVQIVNRRVSVLRLCDVTTDIFHWTCIRLWFGLGCILKSDGVQSHRGLWISLRMRLHHLHAHIFLLVSYSAQVYRWPLTVISCIWTLLFDQRHLNLNRKQTCNCELFNNRCVLECIQQINHKIENRL